MIILFIDGMNMEKGCQSKKFFIVEPLDHKFELFRKLLHKLYYENKYKRSMNNEN